MKRVNLYNQRVWTCARTGRSRLTFQEATKSERGQPFEILGASRRRARSASLDDADDRPESK